MIAAKRVTSTSDSNFAALCETIRSLGLSEQANQELTSGKWPVQKLQACAEAGVFEWFVAEELGGQGWDGTEVIRGYLGLSAACLTTAFALTQLTGAVRRIAHSGNQQLIERLIPKLISGKAFATVGISHLTTSRQHLTQPVLHATLRDSGFTLDGFSPWVTGATQADFIVTGATLADGRQLLAAVALGQPGVTVEPPARLVGLSASQTGAVRFSQVVIDDEWLLAGPIENVMQSGLGARTGGLQTSTLALGLTASAVAFVQEESRRREELADAADQLHLEWEQARLELLRLAEGDTSGVTAGDLRAKSNSLVLRATQSALAAAKGAGYVDGHPVGRWCREALFFLVWSCPQPVVAANLCEFAHLE